MNIGVQELLVILAIVLILFGGRKLPEVARGLGKAVRIFRSELSSPPRNDSNEAPAEREEGQAGGQTSA